MAYCVAVFLLSDCCFTEFLCWYVCWLVGFWMFVLRACFISETENGNQMCSQSCGLRGLVPPHTESIIGFSAILEWFWDPILKAFRAPRARNPVLFSGSFPCHFWHRFWFETRVPEALESRCLKDCWWFRCRFLMCFVGFGCNFDDVWCRGGRLKI